MTGVWGGESQLWSREGRGEGGGGAGGGSGVAVNMVWVSVRQDVDEGHGKHSLPLRVPFNVPDLKKIKKRKEHKPKGKKKGQSGEWTSISQRLSQSHLRKAFQKRTPRV